MNNFMATSPLPAAGKVPQGRNTEGTAHRLHPIAEGQVREPLRDSRSIRVEPLIHEKEAQTMSTADETRTVVEGYFKAWTTRKTDEAYALLAPNLHFAGPNATCETAEQFKPGLIGFAALAKSAQVVELLVDGDRAAMLYDCELPPPANTVRIASFFRVENGKIRWYETQFDAEGFRQLVAKSRGK
jgi:hypothetical protein